MVQYFKSMTIEKDHVCDSLEEATQNLNVLFFKHRAYSKMQRFVKSFVPIHIISLVLVYIRMYIYICIYIWICIYIYNYIYMMLN